MDAPSAPQSIVQPAQRARIHWTILRLLLRSCLSALIFLLGLELALRIVRFEHRPYISRVKNNQLRAEISTFRQDPALMWAPNPNDGTFNSKGFIGAELPLERTADTCRIACLGDSCTQLGSPPYPALLGHALADRGYESVEVMNWGVAGYSSYQGLKRMERHVVQYQPEIYLIYFGWNDHWIRNGVPDDAAAVRFARCGSVRARLEETRVAQATALIRDTMFGSTQTVRFRVPLDSYRRNLRHMIRTANDRNSKVVLITAPDCLNDDQPIASLLCGLDSLGYSDAKSLHTDYVEATREVAEQAGVGLFDAAMFFHESVSGCEYFLVEHDPVHLTQPGLEILANQLASYLIGTGWLDTPRESTSNAWSGKRTRTHHRQ